MLQFVLNNSITKITDNIDFTIHLIHYPKHQFMLRLNYESL